MCRALFSVLLLSIFYNIKAQNLVLNPSFEDYTICPNDEEQLEGYVDFWTTYFTTPDYFNLCDLYPWYVEDITGPTPRTGNGLVGCSWYKGFNATNPFREYIHGQLSTPLINGELYYAEFYTNRAFSFAINNYQMHFSAVPVDAMPTDGILNVEAHISNNSGVITLNEWVKISGCYLASGGERFLTLGNFETNENTDTIWLSPNSQQHYAIIDDVAVYQISTLIPNDTIIVEGESIFLPDYAGQQYYLEGEIVDSDELLFEWTGSYLLEVYLEECGKIGEFEVTVMDCTARAADFNSWRDEYEQLCIEDEQLLLFPPQECCVYFLNDTLIQDSTYLPQELGVYEITVHIPDCVEIANYIIEVVECDSVSHLPPVDCFYFPNVFSPNFDGINDDFRVYGDCEVIDYQLDIYNRWGGHLFRTDNITDNWDGSRAGEMLESGVYVYTALIEYIDMNGNTATVRLSGDVLLLL